MTSRFSGDNLERPKIRRIDRNFRVLKLVGDETRFRMNINIYKEEVNRVCYGKGSCFDGSAWCFPGYCLVSCF